VHRSVHKSPFARFSRVSGANGELCATNSPLAHRTAVSGAKCTLAASACAARPYLAIAWEALECEGITVDQAHLDTTSLSVKGAYDQSSQEDSPLRIDYGYSKDKRKDLKQLMFGLGSVQGIPLFADVMNGNTSDKKWNGDFAIQMADLLPFEQLQNMIAIADSAMVTEENLAIYGDRPFISRLPETYSLCQELPTGTKLTGFR
jgi:transposase